MSEKELYSLIDEEKIQVFLCTSKVSLPFSFANHTWFVVSKYGKVNRWEVGSALHLKTKEHWGHVCLNGRKPFAGMKYIYQFPFSKKFETQILEVAEGEHDSLADRLAEFIETRSLWYKYRHKYIYTGPNSNTYTQWVIDSFPELNWELPVNAFGRYYERVKEGLIRYKI